MWYKIDLILVDEKRLCFSVLAIWMYGRDLICEKDCIFIGFEIYRR